VSPRPTIWWLKLRKAAAIVGIAAACGFFVWSAWYERWAAAGVWVAVAFGLGGYLRYQREAWCPNNLCNHDYSLHALNLSNDWVCKFDGCFCGKPRLPKPHIF
jgi:hypothetical protein